MTHSNEVAACWEFAKFPTPSSFTDFDTGRGIKDPLPAILAAMMPFKIHGLVIANTTSNTHMLAHAAEPVLSMPCTMHQSLLKHGAFSWQNFPL